MTDNGELVSNSMAEWCSQFGTDHQRTAPYTSAQTGRAERLHRTILDKARAMLISCRAPSWVRAHICTSTLRHEAIHINFKLRQGLVICNDDDDDDEKSPAGRLAEQQCPQHNNVWWRGERCKA